FVTAALSSSLLAALAIAEHMRQEHVQRLEVQAELKHTYEAMPIGLFTLDLRGRFMSANPALLAMLSPNVLSDGGNTWQQYFVDGAWTQLHQMVHGKTEDEMEIKGKKMLGFTGSKRFLVKATLARDRIEGSLQDVTEKSRATEDLYFLANHDSLTKALNRRGIEKVLNGAIAKLTEGNALALAYLDLDRFKLINDLFGHGAGDDVLQQVCKRVSNMLSRDLQFGRVGGDEFVIVFPETPIALASILCQGIVDAIGTQPYRVGDKAFYVRGSIGLIEVSTGMQFNDAMSTADRACRQAKSANGGGLVVYEKHAIGFQQHEAELKLIALLSTSSATDGLYLEMQPIMSLTKPHESLNFEVLLRMRDPDGKVVPTDRLIAAAESSGRMGMIDRWVLTTTLAWLNTNYRNMTRTKFVCMNLSGASLNDERFLQEVYAMLEKNMHIVGKLCLEITESVALHDLKNTRRFVDKVRGYGAKVALDDFGAGYTSFSYLKEFTADLLKIDGSFIVNMNKHPANIAIVEAIVSLARNLGMKVIAEWAEDNATVQTLTEIGVDYVQGFAVARSQHPDKMLSAESSASFIQNEELAQYVNLIGKSEHMVAQVDLFSETRAINLH
ncbi:MAG: EAL domain-containing protein, partial [Rhodoferax sp.]